MMQHYVKFKYVIFDSYTITFDWVFHVRKIFDWSEIVKDKIQQAEQNEQKANQKKWKKKNYQIMNRFEIYCIFTLEIFLEKISKIEFHFVKSVDMQLATNDW